MIYHTSNQKLLVFVGTVNIRTAGGLFSLRKSGGRCEVGVTFIISVLVCTVIALLSTLQTTTNFLQVGSPNVLTTRTSLHEYYDVVNKSRRTKQDSISFREYSMFISTYELIDAPFMARYILTDIHNNLTHHV